MDSKLRIVVMGQQALFTTLVGARAETATHKVCIVNYDTKLVTHFLKCIVIRNSNYKKTVFFALLAQPAPS
jgi:hypothetical protein